MFKRKWKPLAFSIKESHLALETWIPRTIPRGFLILCEKDKLEKCLESAEAAHYSFLSPCLQDLVAMTNSNSKAVFQRLLQNKPSSSCLIWLLTVILACKERNVWLEQTPECCQKGASRSQCVTGQSFNPPGETSFQLSLNGPISLQTAFPVTAIPIHTWVLGEFTPSWLF